MRPGMLYCTYEVGRERGRARLAPVRIPVGGRPSVNAGGVNALKIEPGPRSLLVYIKLIST